MKFFEIPTLLTAAFSVALPKDATLEERATGKDVTEAVLRKISRSNIFPDDHSFLIRLAYVESRFGSSTHTFRAGYYGGIWQVDQSYYNQTLQPSLTTYHVEIQKHFNISWTSTTWEDLLKPLHSGLAAALYFKTKTNPPETIIKQSDFWKTYYRMNGDATKFRSDSAELRDQTKCRGKMDFCIVLDGSGSIGAWDFAVAKNFTASLIESFSLDFTRIGMIVYSSGTDIIFEINNNHGKQELEDLARNTRYPSGSTRTDLGILAALTMLNAHEQGTGVPKIMTVFTDGNSDSRQLTQDAVSKVAATSIRTVSVGIGNGIDHSELLMIAQNDPQSVFSVSNFDGLQDFIMEITTVACETPQEPVLNQTQSDSLAQDEKRIYKIDLPEEGITIRVFVTSGKTEGYWSRSEPVPSSALHDGAIDGPTFIPRGEARQAVDASVYFTIQGMENTNNYTLTTEEGDKTELEKSTVIIFIVGILLVVLLVVGVLMGCCCCKRKHRYSSVRSTDHRRS